MFQLNGKNIAVGSAFEYNGILYPSNFIQLSTPEEKQAIGLVEIVEQPRPDDRYGYVQEDPENPGQWIFTPFASDVLKQRLSDYIAQKRYAKEVGGVTVNDSKVATDRESQSKIAGAYIYVQANPNEIINWKQPDGTFVSLDATTVESLANAVGAFVQQCFTLEMSTNSQVNDGTITTFEAIDQVFA